MSKFGCSCGHTIVDQTDYLPYKGFITKDQDCEKVYDGIIKSVIDFLTLSKNGEREKWLDKYFLLGYPRDLSDESVLWDHISSIKMNYEVDMNNAINVEEYGFKRDLK